MTNAMPDIPRIYTALAEWSACLIFVFSLRPRFKKKWQTMIAFGFLAVQVIFLELTANIVLWLWLPCMVIAFGLMVLEIYGCCKISLWEAGYYGIFAFVIAEGAASLEWQIWNYFFEDSQSIFLQSVVFLLVTLY